MLHNVSKPQFKFRVHHKTSHLYAEYGLLKMDAIGAESDRKICFNRLLR